jgi:hypothetical protein
MSDTNTVGPLRLRNGVDASGMLRSRRSQGDGAGLPAPCLRWQSHDPASLLASTDEVIE